MLGEKKPFGERSDSVGERGKLGERSACCGERANLAENSSFRLIWGRVGDKYMLGAIFGAEACST